MKKAINILTILFCLIFIVFFILYLYFGLQFPTKYQKEIEKASAVSGISKQTIISVVKAESNFNKDAKSKVGAKGLMQLMPTTAKFVCELEDLEFEENNLFNAEYNIVLGSYYLKYLFNKFKTNKLVFAAYNAGEGTVRTWLSNVKYSKNGEELDYIPYKETSEYVKKVEKNLKIYQKILK